MALPVGSIRAASRRVLSRSRPTSPSAPAPAPASSPSLLTIRWASSSTPTSPPSPAPARRRGFYLPLSLLLVVPAIYYFYPSSPSRRLSPYTYSDHPVSSTTPLGPSHKELAVPIPRESIVLFGTDAVRLNGTPVKKDDGEVVVQHVMIKNPDLQIERPYTPINDVETDGEMRLVVKRVKGGEVGRSVQFYSCVGFPRDTKYTSRLRPMLIRRADSSTRSSLGRTSASVDRSLRSRSSQVHTTRSSW
jgi:cytochrome-b5 reductase